MSERRNGNDAAPPAASVVDQPRQALRDVKAVRGLDSTSPGRVFGFLGPNGAGKSTTI